MSGERGQEDQVNAESQTVSIFEIENNVARITLNRPAAMNALNPDLRWELSQHFDEVERNDVNPGAIIGHGTVK